MQKCRAAFATFCGTDYVKGLPRVGWVGGLQLTQKWSASVSNGTEARFLEGLAVQYDREGYEKEFRQAIEHFLHCPVFTPEFRHDVTSVSDKRTTFFRGEFEVSLQPRQPFDDANGTL